jgi:hypothetical protein
MVHKVVETVFGQSFLRASEQELDLAFIVEKEVHCCAFSGINYFWQHNRQIHNFNNTHAMLIERSQACKH